MRPISGENNSIGGLGAMFLWAMKGNAEFYLFAADWLADNCGNNPEVTTYEVKLREKEPSVLFCLDVVKKFGSKSERKAASKLLRQYHKIIKQQSPIPVSVRYTGRILITREVKHNLMLKWLVNEWEELLCTGPK